MAPVIRQCRTAVREGQEANELSPKMSPASCLEIACSHGTGRGNTGTAQQAGMQDAELRAVAVEFAGRGLEEERRSESSDWLYEVATGCPAKY